MTTDRLVTALRVCRLTPAQTAAWRTALVAARSAWHPPLQPPFVYANEPILRPPTPPLR
ncbi:hypothetical protein ACIOGZ_29760 [Kitasatospora sp. NPDC088160]|uniref:hypothetical protein n=1 Tax=Kitasatospora sp. NPDC088160 TaxID=3364072 RepID=UPI003823A123